MADLKYITLNGDVYVRIDPWWNRVLPLWYRITHWLSLNLSRF